MYSFSKEYKKGFGRGYRLDYVESRGHDLDDLLSNVMISVVDTEYCASDKYTEITDLPIELQHLIEQDMASGLQDALDHQAELAADREADVRAMNKGEA